VNDAVEQVTGVSRRELLDRLRPLLPPHASVQANASASTPEAGWAAPSDREVCPPTDQLVESLRGGIAAMALGPQGVTHLLRSEALKGAAMALGPKGATRLLRSQALNGLR
jgi:hypothetical protein